MGFPVLLEKPIEVDLEAAKKIQEAAKKHNVVCQVGYCLRFNSAVEYIHDILAQGKLGRLLHADMTAGHYLPDWRPGIDFRKVYSANRSQGGGVCLDLSHELDYFRWFLGEPSDVRSFVQRISALEIDVEDISEVIVRTDNGAVGHIHLDYLSRAVRRKLSIIAEKGNIEYDFVTGTLEMYEAGDQFWKKRIYADDRNEMYKKQFQHFMNCVKTRSKPLVDAQDAIKTLEFALRIRDNCENINYRRSRRRSIRRGKAKKK
jgi:predicted dehydrogenase